MTAFTSSAKGRPDQISESARPGRMREPVPALSIPAVARLLWPYLRPSRQRLYWAAVVALLLTGVEIARPLLVGSLVDSILSRLHRRATVPALSDGWLLGLLGAAAILRGLLVTRHRWLSAWVGERVAARMRDALYDHLQKLPLEYIRGRGPGTLLLRFNSDARAIQRLLTNGLIQLAQSALLGVGIFVAMAVLNLRMFLAAAALIPAFAFIFWRFNARLRHQSRATRRRRSRLSAYLHERIAGLPVVKAFTRESAEAEHVKELNRDIARRATRQALAAGQLQGWTAGAVALTGLAVLVVARGEALADHLTAGTLVAFYTLLGLLLPVFQRVATANSAFQEGAISVDRFTRTLKLPPETRQPDKAPELRITSGDIFVQQVSLRLDNNIVVLPEISFRLQRGLTAIVGANGSGKTTLLELLLRFHTPSTGRIVIDGQDIARVSLKSLRSGIGYVAQNSVLFDGSLRENVAYGLPPNSPDEVLERAARLAGIDSMIRRLPDGWNTRVGRDGRHLSVGQQRQVALARALAIDPPILLLDEPTSALDPEIEVAVVKLLNDLAREKTIVIAAHRLPQALQPSLIHTLVALPERVYRPAPLLTDTSADEEDSSEDDE